MLGYRFMGDAHSRALGAVRQLDATLEPELVSISGRDAAALEEARARLGWAEATTDWHTQVEDDRVGLFVNGAPNALHAEPTIAAARSGKHVVCEKPLGRTGEEAREMWQAAEDAGVVQMTGFNYRFVPAVRLARELIHAGKLGEIVHFRARYLQSWGWEKPGRASWRFDTDVAGSGALGDLGSHSIDLARYLVGEIVAISAVLRTFVTGREVDDAFVAAVEFENGAIGTIEASRLAHGRINHNTFEVNGTKGSVAFDQERMNELLVSDGNEFRRVLEHGDWWPHGHIVGWGDTFTYEYLHLLRAIEREQSVAPLGATFEDGYRCALVCDAIARSNETGRRETISAEGL